MRWHPVFLLGAGRSGTTLLYKILCLHADVAYISNYHTVAPDWVPVGVLLKLLARFPALKRRAWFEETGIANSHGKRPWRKRLVPGPVEGEALYRRCGLRAVSPQAHQVPADAACCLRHQFEHIAAFSSAKVLLTKRTANNQRLAWLRDAFPDARFIHLVRDGRAVAYSLLRVRWWDGHRTWWSGYTPQELVDAGEKPLAISARNWVKDVQAVRAGLDGLSAGELLELRYEDLMADPIRQVNRVTDFLGLPFTPGFEAVLRSLDLGHRPVAWKRDWKEADMATVTREQQALLMELGYV